MTAAQITNGEGMLACGGCAFVGQVAEYSPTGFESDTEGAPYFEHFRVDILQELYVCGCGALNHVIHDQSVDPER
jgi:hypothetical protein